MKIKEIGPTEGARVPGAPLDTSMSCNITQGHVVLNDILMLWRKICKYVNR